MAIRRPRDPDEPLTDELEILKRIRCEEGTPRELPDGMAPTLYDLWETAQSAIRAEYEERLDPASGATRVPSSQSWAIELLAREGTGLADHGVRASSLREAASAFSVPRGPLVLRQLSALRRQLRDGDMTAAAAALGVLEIVDREGLRPMDEESRRGRPRSRQSGCGSSATRFFRPDGRRHCRRHDRTATLGSIVVTGRRGGHTSSPPP